ncbi:hypothetical protein D3C71_1666090 [compost metagenome]
MIMPPSAMMPSIATKPSGDWNTSSAGTTPIRPSGAVSTTIHMREKFCSCSMSNSRMVININGATASSALFALSLSSTAPPTSMR